MKLHCWLRWTADGQAATPTNGSVCMQKDTALGLGQLCSQESQQGCCVLDRPPAQVPHELQRTSIHLSESGSGSTVRSIVNVYATSPVYLENRTVGALFRRYHHSTYLHETNHPLFSHLNGLQQNLGPCTFLCATMDIVYGRNQVCTGTTNYDTGGVGPQSDAHQRLKTISTRRVLE